MRNVVLALAVAAAVLTSGAVADRANAFVTGDPASLRAAIEEVNSAEIVHCVPGWRHHLASWGWWNGCSSVPRAVVVVRPRPRFFVAPRRRVIIVR